MKKNCAMLAVGCMVMLGLGCADPVSEREGEIYLAIDKTVYAPEDTIQVSLHNDSNGLVFLEGCVQFYSARKTGAEWVEGVLPICDGVFDAVKINPHSILRKKELAKHYVSGRRKFVAPIYFGCLDDEPIDNAKCNRESKIYSGEFAVAGFENAAGNLIIEVEKSEYRWTPDDLGSSRQIRATIRNDSDRTYYAKLGDGFNSGIDQDDLFIAEGAGGHIEKFNPDSSWIPMPRGLLFEGTGFVALRPQKSYRLTAPLYFWSGDEVGQFRIKVEYFDRIDPSPETSPKMDYSNVFTIVM